MEERLIARTRIALAAATAVALALGFAVGAASATTLSFDRLLPGHWQLAECTEGSVRARCFLVEIGGLVPGLGDVVVRERVLQSGDMDIDFCEPQVRYGTIVAPHGTIDYVARGIDCPGTRELTGGYRAVVVDWVAAGGTGTYAGATGSGHGSVRPDEDEVFIHLAGTLQVPGLEFDTTPPVISVPRTVTARSARPMAVRYVRPLARDAADGDVPVACKPASGARYPVGRTIVRCQAIDSSGNTGVASFAVVVKGTTGA